MTNYPPNTRIIEKWTGNDWEQEKLTSSGVECLTPFTTVSGTTVDDILKALDLQIGGISNPSTSGVQPIGEVVNVSGVVSEVLDTSQVITLTNTDNAVFLCSFLCPSMPLQTVNFKLGFTPRNTSASGFFKVDLEYSIFSIGDDLTLGGLYMFNQTVTVPLQTSDGETYKVLGVPMPAADFSGVGSAPYAVNCRVTRDNSVMDSYADLISVLNVFVDNIPGGMTGASSVTSVFGRDGDVVAVSGDYTSAQVGLGNVTNDAQLKRSASDYLVFPTKAILTAADNILIEDSEDGFNKKAAPYDAFMPTGSVGDLLVHDGTRFIAFSVGGPGSVLRSDGSSTAWYNLGPADVGLSNVTDDAQLKRAANDFTAFTAKTTVSGTDVFIIEDSGAGFVKKQTTLAALGSGILPSGVAGDMIVFSGGQYVKFPVGPSGYAITSNGTFPGWGVVATSGGGSLPSGVLGDLLVHNGTSFTPVHSGSVNQVFTVTGLGSTPGWKDLPIPGAVPLYQTTFSHTGNGAGTSYTINHNLGSTDVIVVITHDLAGTNEQLPEFFYAFGTEFGYETRNVLASSLDVIIHEFAKIIGTGGVDTVRVKVYAARGMGNQALRSYSTTFSHIGNGGAGVPYTITHNLNSNNLAVQVTYDSAGGSGIIDMTDYWEGSGLGRGHGISNRTNNAFIFTGYGYPFINALGTFNITIIVTALDGIPAPLLNYYESTVTHSGSSVGTEYTLTHNLNSSKNQVQVFYNDGSGNADLELPSYYIDNVNNNYGWRRYTNATNTAKVKLHLFDQGAVSISGSYSTTIRLTKLS